MSRSHHTSLASVLLLTLPLAGLVTSGHVHGGPGSPAAGGVVASCACMETTATVQCGPGRDAGDDPDRRLCPICELARSLHAAGLPSVPVLAAPTPVDSAPALAATRDTAAPCIHPSSRSPPPRGFTA